ncbi:MAG: hypothetical protein AAGH89_12440 [Verrucomicrobiota bacterium]
MKGFPVYIPSDPVQAEAMKPSFFVASLLLLVPAFLSAQDYPSLPSQVFST